MGNMVSRKNVDYFEMFEKGISISLKAAECLGTSFADGEISEAELKKVKEAEHEGDHHVHECLSIIERAFITPFDRTDIVEIIKAIENLTDSIDQIASHIYILRFTRADKLNEFVRLLVQSCQKLNDLMGELKQYKKSTTKINEYIIEVNHIEEEGDRAYADSMRRLFEEEKDPVAIIKYMEMYQLLEHSLDCCEDIADMIEKIIVAKT